MGSSTLIIILVVCIIFSAYFSASETAFSSASEIRLKALSMDGNKKAAKVLKILENYDSLLSTILIGNNIVNILASSISTVLFVRWLGEIGTTWSVLVITLVVLIFAEVTPKSVAKEMPEAFAMQVAGSIRVMTYILYPLNMLFSWWKKLITKLFHMQHNDDITEGEFLTMVDEAENGGGIDKKDSTLIHSVLNFNDIDVGDICTPRVDVVAIPLTATKDDVAELFRSNEFSRLPVYDEDIDDIVGFIHQKDFYDLVYSGDKPLSSIVKAVQYVPPTMKISKVLTMLQQKHMHLAVVTDEFGGTDGIITMEDILEELVGEIYDEHDEVEKDIVKTGRNSYIVQCTCDLENMFQYFDVPLPESESNSVGGWLLEHFDKIPVCGDHFKYKPLLITVLKSDSRKVDQIRVTVENNEEHSNTEE